MDLDNYILSLSNILSRVDEYDLYCHYLGFEPDVPGSYSSPLRDDDSRPSFTFFNAYDGFETEFLWKDGALDITGNIANLVMELYGISYTDALRKIDTDFKLGFREGKFTATRVAKNKRIKVSTEKSKIIVNSKNNFSTRGLAYWQTYGISSKTLELFNVTELISAKINQYEFYYSKNSTFAYRIGAKYKIYAPFADKYRFINNFDEKYVEGFNQLTKKSGTLVITKSLKDVMTLYELGYESISPKSESIVLASEYFVWITKHYKYVIVLFDNDMKHNGEKYPYEKKYIPIDSQCKDISDYVKMYGKKKGKWLITNLLK